MADDAPWWAKDGAAPPQAAPEDAPWWAKGGAPPAQVATPATPATPPPRASSYLSNDEFRAHMDATFGHGNWTDTGDFRTQAREDELRRQGAQTVAPGHTSAHSLGDPDHPGAHDIVVNGMTPGQAADVLRRRGEDFPVLLPEGVRGTQGAHLHVGLAGSAGATESAEQERFRKGHAPEVSWNPLTWPALLAGGIPTAIDALTNAPPGSTSAGLDAALRQTVGGFIGGAGSQARNLGQAADNYPISQMQANNGGVELGAQPAFGLAIENQGMTPQERAAVGYATPQQLSTPNGLENYGAGIVARAREQAPPPSTAANIGGFVGGVLPYVNPAAPWLMAASGANALSEKADEQGLLGTPAERMGVAANTGLQGALGAVPFSRPFDAVLDRLAAPSLTKFLSAAAGGGAAGIGMTAGQNAITAASVDPNQDINEGVGDSAAQMAMLSAIFHVMPHAQESLAQFRERAQRTAQARSQANVPPPPPAGPPIGPEPVQPPSQPPQGRILPPTDAMLDYAGSAAAPEATPPPVAPPLDAARPPPPEPPKTPAYQPAPGDRVEFEHEGETRTGTVQEPAGDGFWRVGDQRGNVHELLPDDLKPTRSAAPPPAEGPPVPTAPPPKAEPPPAGPRVMVNRVGRDGLTDAERGHPITDGEVKLAQYRDGKAKFFELPPEQQAIVSKEQDDENFAALKRDEPDLTREAYDARKEAGMKMARGFIENGPQGATEPTPNDDARSPETFRQGLAAGRKVVKDGQTYEVMPVKVGNLDGFKLRVTDDQGIGMTFGGAAHQGLWSKGEAMDRAHREAFGEPQAFTPTARPPTEPPEPVPQAEAPPAEARPTQQPPRPADYGSKNTVFTPDAYEAAKARLRAKSRQVNSGVDPQDYMDLVTIGGFHIEHGTRKFGEWAANVVEDLGDWVRPHLRSIYEGLRHHPEMEHAAADLTPGEEITPEDVQGSKFRAPADEATIPPEGKTDGLPDAVPPSDARTGAEAVPRAGGDGADRGAPEGRPAPGERNGSGGDARRGELPQRGGVPEPAEAVAGQGEHSGPADRLPGGVDQARDRNAGPAGAGGGPERAGPGPATDHVIAEGAVEEGRGPAQKARDNLEAIKIAKAVEAEGRAATPEEKVALAKYVGWGGLSGAFPNPRTGRVSEGFEQVGNDLRATLTPDEYAAAQKSTQYAHYTSEPVVRAMWDAVRRMGFKGGKVFEPGMGIGHFKGMAPEDLPIHYQGVEMDPTSAKIAKALYPKSDVRQGDFVEHNMAPNQHDLAIGNPPFGDITIRADPKYKTKGFLLHDYFFAKSLEGVRPGGLMAFVTSAGTMNKAGVKARQHLAERAEFVGGVRLPETAFAKNAGTHVTTDVLFFKKREKGAVAFKNLSPEDRAWTETVRRDLPNKEGGVTSGVDVNRYFSEHPEQVLGHEGAFDRLIPNRYAVRADEGDLGEQLRGALARLPKDVMGEPPSRTERKITEDFAHGQTKDRSYYVKDGQLMQLDGGAGYPVKGKSAEAVQKIKDAVPIRDALQDVLAANLRGDRAAGDEARARMGGHYDAFVNKHGPINKVVRRFQRPNIIKQETTRAEAREEAREAGGQWFEGDFDAETMAPRDAKAAEIARLRQAARDQARADGLPFDEGSFNPADMDDDVRETRPNFDPFEADPESYRLSSIEDYDPDTDTAKKGVFFYEDPAVRDVEPEINSPHDGVLWSYNRFGRFDLGEVAKKMGLAPDRLVEQLGDAVYHDPAAKGWVTSDEYLSGDVKTKLTEARAAAARDPALTRNVEALEQAQPAPIAPSEIRMRMGMPWVPAERFQDFLRDTGIGQVRLTHSRVLGSWRMEFARQGPEYYAWEVPKNRLSGHTGRSAMDIVQMALDRQAPREVVMVGGGFGERPKPVFNEEATEAVKSKIEQLNDAWDRWLDAEPERRNELADLYNERMNRTVLRKYDGSWLTTPGISKARQLRDHQRRVVARIIQSGNTYMGHAVGAGKTLAMIAAGMEMRRLGLVKKPMYVVPNHMLGQFAKEFYEAYPAARLLIADDNAFITDRRKQFVSDAALGDHDAIIIKHSSFGLIPVSDATKRMVIEAEKRNAEAAIAAARADAGSRFTVKDLQRHLEKLEQELKGAGGKKDNTFEFEQMGVDHLFLDEAHLYRKLRYATKHGNVKGIDPAGSGRAFDLYLKIRALEEKSPGRSAVFASGTPITNTIGEMFSLQRFLQAGDLEAQGLEHFDNWAATFGDVETSLEQSTTGVFKAVTRFRKFTNAPELYKIVGRIMDTVTSGQLGDMVVRPKLAGGERVKHIVEQTPAQEAIREALIERAEESQARPAKDRTGKYHLFSILMDGRKAAIDARLVDGGQPNERSKLNVMLENVHRIWKESGNTQFYDPGDKYQTKLHRGPATQMIFADLGVHQNGENPFTTYKWIKRDLVSRGIPEKQIAFIQDYKNAVAKQRLFNDMNEGKVRVLVGSVEAMGVGTNVQRQLLAVHNMDPHWYPANDEQRVGRIIRQGNLNPEVQVHDYVTKGSIDSWMWGLMAGKGKAIEDFWRGDPDLRDIEDVGEADMMAQLSAMTQADPRIMQLEEMRQELKKLERERTAHDRGQYAMRDRIKEAKRSVQWADEEIGLQKQNIAQRTDTRGEAFRATVGGEEFAKRADAADAMEKHYEEIYPGMKDEERARLMKVGGFDVMLHRLAGGAPQFELRQAGAEPAVLGGAGDPAKTILTRAENHIAKFEERHAYAERRKGEHLATIESLQRHMGEAFGKGDQIEDLGGRVKGLEATLKAEAAAHDQQVKARRTPTLPREEGGGGMADVSAEEPAPTDLRRDPYANLPPDIAEAQRAIDRASRTFSANPVEAMWNMLKVGKFVTTRGIDTLLGLHVSSIAKTVPEVLDKVLPDTDKVLGKVLRYPGRGLTKARDVLGNWADPMSAIPRDAKGRKTAEGRYAQATSADAAQAMRAADIQWGLVDKVLASFPVEAQRRMYEAADEENVLRERQKTPGKSEGLNRLNPEERKAVTDLHDAADKRWPLLRALKMTTREEPMAFWTPRMIVDMASGLPESVGGKSSTASGMMGGDLPTTTGSLRQRKHETIQETEEAAKKKFGEGAQVVRNIRTMALALRELDQAIAGRTLVRNIQRRSREIGKDDGKDKTGDKKFFTKPDHSAFIEYVADPKRYHADAEGKWVPGRDENGKVITVGQLIHIPIEYRGPLDAILQGRPGELEQAFNALKSKSVGSIMYSPLTHNQVTWGRVFAADPLGVLPLDVKSAFGKASKGKNVSQRLYSLFSRYYAGNAVKNDPILAKEAALAGLAPPGGRGDLVDLTGIAANRAGRPGEHTWVGQGGGAVISHFFGEHRGEQFKAGVDRFNDFRHNTLLWDRVTDLAYGVWQKARDDNMRMGMDQLTASRTAAHFANLYVASLPKEAMSKAARLIANVMFFSRNLTFAVGGTGRTIWRGLPEATQAQIARDSGMKQLAMAQGAARRKAIGFIAADVALLWGGAFVAQATWNLVRQLMGDDPKDLHSSLENEPGKKTRVDLGPDKYGTHIHVRLPAGRGGEDFQNWADDPVATLRNKLSPQVRFALELASNNTSSTSHPRKLYDDTRPGHFWSTENVAKIVGRFFQDQLPLDEVEAASDTVTGNGDDRTNLLRTLGGLTGFSISHGARGGPEAGAINAINDRHQLQLDDHRNEIIDAIRSGDHDLVNQRIRELKLDKGEVNALYRQATGAPPSAGRTRHALGRATPAETDAYLRAAGVPAH